MGGFIGNTKRQFSHEYKKISMGIGQVVSSGGGIGIIKVIIREDSQTDFGASYCKVDP